MTKKKTLREKLLLKQENDLAIDDRSNYSEIDKALHTSLDYVKILLDECTDIGSLKKIVDTCIVLKKVIGMGVEKDVDTSVSASVTEIERFLANAEDEE